MSNDGIVNRIKHQPMTEIITYEPGNRTRYVVQFTEVTDPEASKVLHMAGEPGWIITHLNYKESNVFIFPSYCRMVFPHEVASKMNECSADADALAKLIAYVTGAEYAGDN
jgi:hypothetical protein